MKVLGLITEYNPFHNGHKYHLLQSKEVTGATHTVAVMSGNFLQRGDIALLNKWFRAEMAIREGVDLVLELPTLYACSSAELFAYGAISLLNNLNIVDSICFGSESGDIEVMKKIAKTLIIEPEIYKNVLKRSLIKGLSYPEARSIALENYFCSNDMSEIVKSPNNILSIEYLKAIIKTKSTITPFTIKRTAADYLSTEINGNICSATAIRSYLYNNKQSIDALNKVIPPESFNVLYKTIEYGYAPVFLEDLEQIILFKLRESSREFLKGIMDLNEGLENRIKTAALEAHNLETFFRIVSTKRYPLTRIKRIVLHAILNIFKNDYEKYYNLGGSLYIRVLGFSSKGAEILKLLKNCSSIPIITNISKQYPTEKNTEMLFQKDIDATYLYSLAYPMKKNRVGSSEFTRKPFILD